MNLQKVSSLLLVTVILLNPSCRMKRAEDGCSRFRNGKFTFKLKGSSFPVSFTIERKGSIQLETETITGKHSKLLVKWTGDCSYEMKMIETTVNLPDSIQRVRKTIPFKAEILSWTKDYYIFRASQGNSPALTDTMWVVE